MCIQLINLMVSPETVVGGHRAACVDSSHILSERYVSRYSCIMALLCRYIVSCLTAQTFKVSLITEYVNLAISLRRPITDLVGRKYYLQIIVWCIAASNISNLPFLS